MSDTAREALLARADVPDEDIDDVIGLAAELQEADRAAASGASVAQVEAVAAELDIAPEYVERAIARLHQDREAALDAARLHELRAQERWRQGLMIAGTVLAVVAVFGLGQVMLARNAATELRAAATDLEHAANYVDVVVERQAALVPQLVALAGGDPGALEQGVRALHDAETFEERIQASLALDRAVTEALTTLPLPRSDDEALQRLGLQHEIAGIQNRRATERRRHRDAERAWREARSRPGAGWALRLGMVQAPET